MEGMAKETKDLIDKVVSIEKDLEQSMSNNKDLKEELKKGKEVLKLLGGSRKLLSRGIQQINHFRQGLYPNTKDTYTQGGFKN